MPTSSPALPAELSVHAMDEGSAPMRLEQYDHQQFYVGEGQKIIAQVTGIDLHAPIASGYLRDYGYSRPTIAEARAIATEIIRRWNGYAQLEARVTLLESLLSGRSASDHTEADLAHEARTEARSFCRQMD